MKLHAIPKNNSPLTLRLELSPIRSEMAGSFELVNYHVTLIDVVTGSQLVDVCNTEGEDYRFGFNTQEKDNETERSGVLEGNSFKIKYTEKIAGKGNHNTALFWEYDTRLGRRWNLDPKPNVSISDYATFANNPILYKDPQGDTTKVYGYDGKYISTLLDGKKNAVVVLRKHTDINLQRVMTNVDKNPKAKGLNLLSSVARGSGKAYAIDDIIKWDNKNRSSGKFRVNQSYYDKTKMDGKIYTFMPAEFSTSLITDKVGLLTPNSKKTSSFGEFRSSPGDDIHSHPYEFSFSLRIGSNGEWESNDNRYTPDPYASDRGDGYSGRPSDIYNNENRKLITNPSSVILLGGQKSQDIRIDKNDKWKK